MSSQQTPVNPWYKEVWVWFILGILGLSVVLGTSTSGLDEGDEHVRHMAHGEASTRWQYPQQELGDPSRFLANWLQLEGPAYTISTACSSSARAMIGGKRLIEAGLVDIAIVGGADTLSRMPVNGFNSLESFSPTLCEPFGRDRRGITIGEAAALMVLSREPADVALLGTGESSDAYHISAPHPQGDGAIRAITQALSEAGMQPDDIGYINLHGTATPANDAAEGKAVAALFGNTVPCSSTKGATGHTLGAAGAVEAIASTLAVKEGIVPPTINYKEPDPDCDLDVCPNEARKVDLDLALSVSLGFGGHNACIAIRKVL